MKIRIIITPDGEIGFFADEGTFDQASEKLEMLKQDLQALGLALTDIGKIEQHKHDQEHAHTHATAEAHN